MNYHDPLVRPYFLGGWHCRDTSLGFTWCFGDSHSILPNISKHVCISDIYKMMQYLISQRTKSSYDKPNLIFQISKWSDPKIGNLGALLGISQRPISFSTQWKELVVNYSCQRWTKFISLLDVLGGSSWKQQKATSERAKFWLDCLDPAKTLQHWIMKVNKGTLLK